MDGPTTSNSSRVKVEYTDPSGIYSLISTDLSTRLPLRNLHWNSASRPLRSIDSLYVELVADESILSQHRTASSAGLPDAQDDAPSQAVAADAPRGPEPFPPRRERRHQIPGLRQTPYLKVYLLRCDDVDSYKSSARKFLREWIKTHTPPSQSSTSVNNQENHDAFEWMIVHVVLPDVHHGTLWPNKSSQNVLDRVRSDFNSSSKSAMDRVAQIPATRSLQVQGSKIDPIPTGLGRDEFMREVNRAWDDLLMKVKALILTSFDLRVRQYEEDIKEKISQRTLPGWNFCTFFVLKEGLARGFESVGLVEDALMGYDELSLELSVAIQEQRSKAIAGQEADLFQKYTQELLSRAESAETAAYDASAREQTVKKHSLSLLNADRKQYRELILANNISAFDFEIYVFARQVTLLSRMATLSLIDGSDARGVESKDPVLLAEICRRAVVFITSMGGTIREDLRASFKSKAATGASPLTLRYNIVENIVASLTYNSCQQILTSTAPKSFIQQLQQMNSRPLMLPGNSLPGYNSTIGKSSPLPNLPTRMSSLLGRMGTETASSHRDNFVEDLTLAQKLPVRGDTQTGLYLLAGQRAEVYLVAKRALSGLGRRRGWRIGWSSYMNPSADAEEGLDEVSLDDAPREQTGLGMQGLSLEGSSSVVLGLEDESLCNTLSSRASFYSTYEHLITAACNHYKLSGDVKSAEAMMSEIALIGYYLGDYTTAASYLHQLAPFYAGNDWTALETSILDMYAQCLKNLDRWDEFIKIALKLVAKTMHPHPQRQNMELKTLGPTSSKTSMYGPALIDGARYLADLLATSRKLEETISTPMMNYFKDVHVDPYLRHFGNKDGFQLSLRLHHMLQGELAVQQVQVRLVSIGIGQPREVWLSSDAPMRLKRGPNTVMLTSMVMIPDWYTVDKIAMSVEKILFTHTFSPTDDSKLFAGSRASMSSDGLGTVGQRILVWPANGSFKTQVSLYREIHLEQPRSILCELSSGRNDILRGELVIRAASAGLRLHTANAELVAGDSDLSDVSSPGSISFRHIPQNSVIKVRIPYRLDGETKEINLRTEVTYTTANGEFVYGDSHSLMVVLPLGVNVHDVFKQDVLFSKFAMSSSTDVPLRLLDCYLEGTKDFRATSPKMETTGICVFAKQPISMVYKIVRNKSGIQSREALQTKLSMRIKYICLDEEILATILDHFHQSLQQSEFFHFWRLLASHLRVSPCTRLSLLDLEMIGLLREINIGTFQDFHWEQILIALNPEVRLGLRSWLSQWHDENVAVALPSQWIGEEARNIVIPVDVPQMQVVHTAQLRLLNRSNHGGSQASAIGVGHSIPAEVILRFSRGWDTSGEGLGPQCTELEFCYELEASPDTWLIGGRRKAQYSAKENETVVFPVLLIAQRAGHLMYPSIDVRHMEEQGMGEQGMSSPQGGGPNGGLSCEVDYVNQGEAILVVADVSSTTVSLDGEGSNGGAWLVEAQSRRAIAP